MRDYLLNVLAMHVNLVTTSLIREQGLLGGGGFAGQICKPM